jgi:tyrosyl-tRNA synthetase
VLKTKDEAAANVARIKELVRPFLDFDGTDPACEHPAILVDNLDWTAPMSALDFLRDIGKHFRVNQMIRKEAVARRLESQEGISYTEFSYQLLQALDFLELYRATGAPCRPAARTSGATSRPASTSSTGRGRVGARARDALLTDCLGGEVRQVRGQRDLALGGHDQPLRLLPVLPQRRGRLGRHPAQGLHRPRIADEIAELERQVVAEPFRRAAQTTLAAFITTLVHGAAATASRAGGLGGDLRQGRPRSSRRRRPGATRLRSCRG